MQDAGASKGATGSSGQEIVPSRIAGGPTAAEAMAWSPTDAIDPSVINKGNFLVSVGSDKRESGQHRTSSKWRWRLIRQYFAERTHGWCVL